MNRLRQNMEGIDRPINRLQKSIYDNLSINFPGADIQGYPRVYKVNSKEGIILSHFENGEYDPVMYSENALRFFFIDSDIAKGIDFKDYRNGVNIIFIANLDKLYPVSSELNDEVLVSLVLKQVHKENAFYGIEEITKGIRNVMDNYRSDNIKFDDTYPLFYFEVRGTMEVNYNY